MTRAYRLVTLTGPVGVGKSRLALEAAEQMSADFPDGVWLVDLSAVDEPGAVMAAVASALNIDSGMNDNSTATITAALAGQSRLLVFDNCEHVVDAVADIVETTLLSAPDVRVVATSRESLQLPGERLVPVSPLNVDAGDGAVELFIDRARAAVPGISLTRDFEVAAVIEICRRLDGIPLAVESAASRLSAMSVTELRDRLDDRFRLLTGARRTVERHRSLLNAVRWSYDLLTEPEKALLARCSVFVGTFDLAAVTAVCGFSDDLSALDLLDALARKSVLNVDRSAQRTRYSMLETIRIFSAIELRARGESAEIRAAYARFFANARLSETVCPADVKVP